METTPRGKQVAVRTIDNNSGGGGNLFGLAVKPHADAVYFVDDFSSDNNLQLFCWPTGRPPRASRTLGCGGLI